MPKILICGLSGSGKTTLATSLAKALKYNHFNADAVRAEANDWDFSPVGRLRQARRLAALATDSCIIDTIAPLRLYRVQLKADKIIWMNTVSKSKYEDTDTIFEPVLDADITISGFNYDVNSIINALNIESM